MKAIAKFGGTQLFAPPTVWIAILRDPDFDNFELTTLSKCYYGAAIMPIEILKELSKRLPNALFWNFYGQTEVAPLATALQPERSEEHTSELQSRGHLVCRLLLEKKNTR